MSAVNIFATSSKVHLLTDAAVYGDDGIVTEFAVKAWPVATFRAAITFRGNTIGPALALKAAAGLSSFDDFVARSDDVIREDYLAAVEAGQVTAQPLCEIWLAGWGERANAPKVYVLASHAQIGVEPWCWHDALPEPGYILGPHVDIAGMWTLRRQGVEPDADYKVDDFDPVKHGLPIMEVQRRTKTDPAFVKGAPFHCIGGGVTCTTIDAAGVTQAQIHTWPDAIGEPITPAPDRANLPVVAPSFLETRRDRQSWLAMWNAGQIDPTTLMPRRRAA